MTVFGKDYGVVAFEPLAGVIWIGSDGEWSGWRSLVIARCWYLLVGLLLLVC